MLVCAGVLLPFLPHFFFDSIPFEDDLVNYFWPVMHHVAADLRAGHLPLWTADIFTGFPLFADPEAGTLFPLNWLLVMVDGAAGMRLVLVGSAAVGAISVFLYVRNLGLSTLPSAMAGWVFALGGFATGHLVHVSITNSACLMPLLLLAADRALLAPPRRRIAWLVLAAGVHALQWLGGHVQPPLMSLLLLSGYLIFRNVARAAAATRSARLKRTLHWLVLWPGAVFSGAMSLAAIQILPTLELLAQSRRSSPASPTFAASYQFSPFDWLTLIWPYFFQSTEGVRWGLWANWETAAYVGILPLMLATLAMLSVVPARSRTSMNRGRVNLISFYGLVALLSLWLALGDYAPISLYRLLESLPPFNLLRASARFVFVFDFALAVLAACGAEIVLSGSHLAPYWRNRLAWTYALVLICLLSVVLVVAGWIGANGDAAIAWLASVYSSAPNSGLLPEPRRMLDYLKESVWLGTPHFAQSVVILLSSGIAITIALQRRGSTKARGLMLVAVTLADLTVYSSGFWSASSATNFAQPDRLITTLGSDTSVGRVLDLRPIAADSNQLLQVPISNAGGYSSLELSREAQLRDAINTYSNRLLDLSGVSHIILPAQVSEMLRLSDVRSKDYDLRRPVLNLSYATPLAERTFKLKGGKLGGIILVSALAHAPQVPQGEVVGHIILSRPGQHDQLVVIRAGLETAEWALERADVAAVALHGPAPIAYSQLTRDEVGAEYERHLYSATIPVMSLPETHDDPVELRLEVTVPGIHWLVYKLAFEQRPMLGRFDLASFRTEHDSKEGRIIRNLDSLPRAWLVHQSVQLRGDEVLRRLNSPDFDPEETLLLEDIAPQPQPCAHNALGDCAAEFVSITVKSDQLTLVHVDAAADAYLVLADTWYPGWVARDGDTILPLYRGDYNYRAVFVARGPHDVSFSYEPQSQKLGALVTVLSMAVGICVLCWGMVGSATSAGVPPCA